MLITSGNIQKYFPQERYIRVPHKDIFTTIIFHAAVIFAAQVVCFNILAVISTIVLIIEAYYVYAVVYKIWVRAGYSRKLFFIGGGALIFIGFILAYFPRSYLLSLL